MDPPPGGFEPRLHRDSIVIGLGVLFSALLRRCVGSRAALREAGRDA